MLDIDNTASNVYSHIPDEDVLDKVTESCLMLE